jgi:hypothetical protein
MLLGLVMMMTMGVSLSLSVSPLPNPNQASCTSLDGVYCDMTRSHEARIKDLNERLTLKEKVRKSVAIALDTSKS